MSNTPITESEVKQFIRDWFRKLDVHPPVEEVLPLVAETLLMKMPEGPFERHEGFKKWYEGANKFSAQVHTIKGVRITPDQDTAKVEVVLQWQRSILNAPDAESGRSGFYAAQTWELERSPRTQRLFIVMYNVDYFVPEVSKFMADENLKAIYQELCASYRAIDDFRAKLLGFLPLATGTGIFFLSDKLQNVQNLAPETKSPLAAVGAFGFLITLGLFSYEIFGIKKCADLISAGKRMEALLRVEDGQFIARPPTVAGLINEPFAAGVIYSTVLASWTFFALAFARPEANPLLPIVVLLVGFTFTLIYDFLLRKDPKKRSA